MCGLLGSHFLPFIPFWARYHSGESLYLPTKPMLFFSMIVGCLAINPAISLHCVYYSFTFLFISYYPVAFRVDVPAASTHFFINFLLRASLAHFHVFTSFGLIGQHSYHVILFYHFIHWVFSAHLLLLYLFLLTWACLLLNSLGFLSPFTTSLPLITLLGLSAIQPAH